MSDTAAVQCRQYGQGTRPALAIHCSLGHGGAWRGLGMALADVWTMRAFDLPGHGKSAAWKGDTDFHAACTDIARAQIEEPVDLIGHSFGATVALRIAIEHPAVVRTLTLIEPVFFAAVRQQHPERYVAYQRLEKPYSDALQDGDFPLAARLFNRLWGDGTPWDHLPKAARTYMTDRMFLIPLQAPAIIDDNAGLFRASQMERANMPCLLIKGAQSPEIISDVHQVLAQRLPKARRVSIEGAGHMVPITHPMPVADGVRSMIEAL